MGLDQIFRDRENVTIPLETSQLLKIAGATIRSRIPFVPNFAFVVTFLILINHAMALASSIREGVNKKTLLKSGQADHLG